MGALAVVLMGVSGSGKTTVGRVLARRLGWAFLDADDFHSPRSVEKMRRGEPLTDDDRGPWLHALAASIRRHVDGGESVVLACSALKASYREVLQVDDRVRFAFLRADPSLLEKRLAGRSGHYFAPGLLQSQLETLEPPADALTLDASRPPAELAREVERVLVGNAA
ncbi:MAG TPA: gluconokinase [Vicinamibacteria bacterium]